MIVYSHRGIDLEREEKFPENSLAAFRWAAQNGFGLELDLQMTADKQLIVAHDATVEKWTGGKSKNAWAAMRFADIEKLQVRFGAVCTLVQVADLMREFLNLHVAIHVKGANQNQTFLNALAETLRSRGHTHLRTLIFDLKPESGSLLRKQLPYVGLAASVAHEFDVKRFNALTHGTLFTPAAVFAKGQDFDWAWMDEWDRTGPNEERKNFYDETASLFQRKKIKVALISPELHKNEFHPDCDSMGVLMRRWKALLALQPDAICTDYPTRLSSLSRASALAG